MFVGKGKNFRQEPVRREESFSRPKTRLRRSSPRCLKGMPAPVMGVGFHLKFSSEGLRAATLAILELWDSILQGCFRAAGTESLSQCKA